MSDKKLTITVDGYDASRVEDWLDERVGNEVSEALDRKVTKAVEARVREVVDDLTRSRVMKDIEAVLEEGWVQTDQWGNPKGEKKTLRDRVRGVLDTPADSYDRMSKVEKWLKEAVDFSLKGVLDEETKSARARLRKSFDDVLQAKFTTTIREALGLE